MANTYPPAAFAHSEPDLVGVVAHDGGKHSERGSPRSTVVPLQRARNAVRGIGSELEVLRLRAQVARLQAEVESLTSTVAEVTRTNEELAVLTRTDPLTGVANRREFDRRIGDEYERLTRSHSPELSLILLDVDRFRDFNTKYGHQIGDEVLRKVGSVLRDCVREVDTAARYGGEEFAVILPATDGARALIVAERIRTSLEAVIIHTEHHGDLKVTASLGVSTHRTTGDGWKQLIAESDEALYAAKNGGRNQVRHSAT